MPQYKALVFSIVGDITAEPAISSGFYSVQASAALRDSWKLGRTLQLVSGVGLPKCTQVRPPNSRSWRSRWRNL